MLIPATMITATREASPGWSQNVATPATVQASVIASQGTDLRFLVGVARFGSLHLSMALRSAFDRLLGSPS